MWLTHSVQITEQKTATLLSLRLTDRQLALAGLALHYGLAMSWAPLYGLIRRRWHTPVVPTALGVGAAMSVIADEGLTPLSGSAPPTASTRPSRICAGSSPTSC